MTSGGRDRSARNQPALCVSADVATGAKIRSFIARVGSPGVPAGASSAHRPQAHGDARAVGVLGLSQKFAPVGPTAVVELMDLTIHSRRFAAPINLMALGPSSEGKSLRVRERIPKMPSGCWPTLRPSAPSNNLMDSLLGAGVAGPRCAILNFSPEIPPKPGPSKAALQQAEELHYFIFTPPN